MTGQTDIRFWSPEKDSINFLILVTMCYGGKTHRVSPINPPLSSLASYDPLPLRLGRTDDLFLFKFILLLHTACGILVPRPGIEPLPHAVETESLNHWTGKFFLVLKREAAMVLKNMLLTTSFPILS